MNVDTSESDNATKDPFMVLGLTTDASETEIRARYLELIKQYPPERDPQKFREIHAAYQNASNPLVLASAIMNPREIPPTPWSKIIEQHERRKPRFDTKILLSFGNPIGVDE
ncbi:MAG: DnaJ domain-containing protein [Pirellulaceae bacterium]